MSNPFTATEFANNPHRTASIALAIIISATSANAKGDAHIWPQFAFEESIATIPPMGVVIDERWPDIDYREIVLLRAAPTDSNCESFDLRYGDGAAARVMDEESVK